MTLGALWAQLQDPVADSAWIVERLFKDHGRSTSCLLQELINFVWRKEKTLARLTATLVHLGPVVCTAPHAGLRILDRGILRRMRKRLPEHTHLIRTLLLLILPRTPHVNEIHAIDGSSPVSRALAPKLAGRNIDRHVNVGSLVLSNSHLDLSVHLGLNTWHHGLSYPSGNVARQMLWHQKDSIPLHPFVWRRVKLDVPLEEPDTRSGIVITFADRIVELKGADSQVLRVWLKAHRSVFFDALLEGTPLITDLIEICCAYAMDVHPSVDQVAEKRARMKEALIEYQVKERQKSEAFQAEFLARTGRQYNEFEEYY
jgi:hypothetical protein